MRPLLNVLPGKKQAGPRAGNSIRLGPHNKWWPNINAVAAAEDNANFRILHNGDSQGENLNTHGFENVVSVTANKVDSNEHEVPTDAINVKQTIEWH